MLCTVVVRWCVQFKTVGKAHCSKCDALTQGRPPKIHMGCFSAVGQFGACDTKHVRHSIS